MRRFLLFPFSWVTFAFPCGALGGVLAGSYAWAGVMAGLVVGFAIWACLGQWYFVWRYDD